ncbi:DUF3833 family protein [Roseivivax sp. CAU 1761]
MDMLLVLALAAALVLAFHIANHYWASFAAQRPEDYGDGQPAFDLREHLAGPILCEGVIYGPRGRVVSRFVGRFHVDWDGDDGVMTEQFLYDTGETQDREWRLSLRGDGFFDAYADDVPDRGRGRQLGSAVQLRYKLRLAPSAGGHLLDAVDWMYLAPNGTIINRSQFRKFGIKVAELVATMRKVPG